MGTKNGLIRIVCIVRPPARKARAAESHRLVRTYRTLPESVPIISSTRLLSPMAEDIPGASVVSRFSGSPTEPLFLFLIIL